MAKLYQSIKVILDKLMRHPLMLDLSLEAVVDYSIDFMRIVGVPAMFDNKIELVEIKNYRAALPCDFYQMNQIRKIDKSGIPIATYRSATDVFHISPLSDSLKFDLSYKILGGIIFVDLPSEGVIEISYLGIATDDMGYPLIPDNSSFTRALELYIKLIKFTMEVELGRMPIAILLNTLLLYAFAVGDCQSEFNRLSIDEAESFYNSWRTLIIRPSEHNNNFRNLGTKEKIKLQ